MKKMKKAQISISLAIILIVIMGSVYFITSDTDINKLRDNPRFVGDKDLKIVCDREIVTNNCNLNNIPEDNKVYFDNLDVAISMNYTLCYR
jgi:uncharacterized protein YneF (UPF0154 family)